MRVEINNTKLIPTRSGVARRERIGWPDMLETQTAAGVGGKAKVAAINGLSGWLDVTPTCLSRAGEPGAGAVALERWSFRAAPGVFELVIEGGAGEKGQLKYTSSWASTIETTVELTEKPAGAVR